MVAARQALRDHARRAVRAGPESGVRLLPGRLSSTSAPRSSRCPARARRRGPSRRCSWPSIADRYTVAITNTAGSTLQTEASTALKIEATRVGWPTQSSTAALALLLELAIRVGERRVPRPGRGPARRVRRPARAHGRRAGPGRPGDRRHRRAPRSRADVRNVLFSARDRTWPPRSSARPRSRSAPRCTRWRSRSRSTTTTTRRRRANRCSCFAPSGPSVPRAVDTGRDALRWGGRLYVVTTEGERAFDELDATVISLPAGAGVALAPALPGRRPADRLSPRDAVAYAAAAADD